MKWHNAKDENVTIEINLAGVKRCHKTLQKAINTTTSEKEANDEGLTTTKEHPRETTKSSSALLHLLVWTPFLFKFSLNSVASFSKALVTPSMELIPIYFCHLVCPSNVSKL
jgi:hypothetical protein